MNRTPLIITQLLVINLIFYIGSQFSYDLSRDVFSLFYFENDKFIYSQLITHVYAWKSNAFGVQYACIMDVWLYTCKYMG